MSTLAVDRITTPHGVQGVYDPLKLFTPSETAELLRISPSKLRELVSAGDLRPVRGKRGRGMVFSSGDLIDYIYGGDL